MTKEDYMKLSKERLAKLLVEKDQEIGNLRDLLLRATAPPVIQQARPMCYEPDGFCTNPHMDCVNCPRFATAGTWVTSETMKTKLVATNPETKITKT